MAEGLDAASLAGKLDSDEHVLLIDVRPFLQFNKGHIRGAVNLPCSPLMLRRLEKGGLGLRGYVPVELRDRLYGSGTGASRLVIVVYDAHSLDVDQGVSQTPLCIVIGALSSEKDKFTIFYLSGGYDDFKGRFPQLCATSLVRMPSCSCKGRTGTGQCAVCQRMQPPLSAPISSPLRSSLSLDSAVICNRRPPLAALGEGISQLPPLSASDSGLGDDLCPSEVLPYLRLGSSRHSSDIDLLRSLGVTAVLNVSTSCPNYFDGELRYKNIPVDDTLSAKILPWLDEAIDFIEKIRQSGGRVLVHCAAGISRSSTVCIAYIMVTKQISLMESYDFVKLRRPAIGPNINFMGQLLQFEELHNLGKLVNGVQPRKTSPRLVHQLSSASAAGTAYVDTDIEGLSGILSQLKLPSTTS